MVSRRPAGGSQYEPPSPAATPELRELQLQAAAYDLVERRIREGTASAQETIYFLKSSSRRERAEVARIEAEGKLAERRIREMDEVQSQDQLLQKALDAFAGYKPAEEVGNDVF